MTVNDLIEILQNAAEDGHGERKILVAEQPNYPLAARFEGVYVEGEEEAEDKGETAAVWLVSGPNTSSRNPYSVPRDAWDDAIAY